MNIKSITYRLERRLPNRIQHALFERDLTKMRENARIEERYAFTEGWYSGINSVATGGPTLEQALTDFLGDPS